MNILANFILPAFAHPFMFTMCFPAATVATLAAEVAVFRLVNRDLAWGRIVCLIVIVNIASTLAGFVFGSMFLLDSKPAAMGERENRSETGQTKPWLDKHTVRGYVLAFILTVMIEYSTLRVLRRIATLRRPFISVLLANMASYTALILIVIVCLYHPSSRPKPPEPVTRSHLTTPLTVRKSFFS